MVGSVKIGTLPSWRLTHRFHSATHCVTTALGTSTSAADGRAGASAAPEEVEAAAAAAEEAEAEVEWELEEPVVSLVGSTPFLYCT